MGREYRIKSPGLSQTTRDTILRAAPHFARYLSEYHLYEYRSLTNADVKRMPDSHAALETGGFYVCVNAHTLVTQAVLAYLQGQIEASGQPFELQEL